jgi:hypothetical protein
MKKFVALLAFASAVTAQADPEGQRIIHCQNDRYQVQIFGEMIQPGVPLYTGLVQDLPQQGGEIRAISQNMGYFRQQISTTDLQDTYRDQQGNLTLAIQSKLVVQSGSVGYAGQYTGPTAQGPVFGDQTLCQVNGNLFPTAAPTIGSSGTTCDDNHCIWIQGANFTYGVRVEIRRKGSPQPIAVVQPQDLKHDPANPLGLISFQVPQGTVSVLDNEGVIISVVTPDGYTSGMAQVRMPFTGLRWSGKFDLAYRITLTYDASTQQAKVTSTYIGGQQGMQNEKFEFYGTPLKAVKAAPRVFASRIVDGRGQVDLSQQPFVMDALGSWAVSFDLKEEKTGANTLGVEVELQY